MKRVPTATRTLALSTLTALAANAGAQAVPAVNQANPYLGPNITRTYYAEDLMNQYAQLDMSEGDLFTLEFPTPITDVIYTKEGMISTRIMGSKLIIAALAQKDTVPMAVVLEGDRMQYFVLKFSKNGQTSVKSIRVIEKAAPTKDQPTTSVGQMTAAKPVAVTWPAATVPAAPAATAASMTPATSTTMTTSKATPPGATTPGAAPTRAVDTDAHDPGTRLSATSTDMPDTTAEALTNMEAAPIADAAPATPDASQDGSTIDGFSATTPPPTLTATVTTPAPAPSTPTSAPSTPTNAPSTPVPRASLGLTATHKTAPANQVTTPKSTPTVTQAPMSAAPKPAMAPVAPAAARTPTSTATHKTAPKPPTPPTVTATTTAARTTTAPKPPAPPTATPSARATAATKMLAEWQDQTPKVQHAVLKGAGVREYTITPPTTAPKPAPVTPEPTTNAAPATTGTTVTQATPTSAPDVPTPAQAQVLTAPHVAPSTPAQADVPLTWDAMRDSLLGQSPNAPTRTVRDTPPTPTAPAPAPIKATASTSRAAPAPLRTTPFTLPHSHIPLEAQFSTQYDGKHYVLYYRITNLSNQVFTLDESKLNVRMLNSPVGTNSNRVTQLTPGQTAYGTITLDDARLHATSAMTIEWAARDTDTSRATYMRTMISVKRAPLPNWSNAQHAAVRVAHSGPVIAAGRANTE